MGSVDGVLAVLAVAASTTYVLRDIAASERPAAPPVAPPPVPAPVRAPEPQPVPLPPAVTDGSMLAGLLTEHDERSALRRAGALAVLLTLTLLTAAGVYAVIYRTVSGLG